jgi:TPR repeat protein
MYAKGEGVAVDYAKAKVWWAQAGAKGHEDAIHNLALLEQRMN